MPSARDGVAAASAEARRVLRDKGGATTFSKRDEVALRGALSAAAEKGLRKLEGEWGAWRFTFEIADGSAKLSHAVSDTAKKVEASEASESTGGGEHGARAPAAAAAIELAPA